MHRILPLAIVVVLTSILAWLLWFWEPDLGSGPQHQALELAAPPTGGDFRLESQGGTLDLETLRGKVVLIYFGYTWCPDICPTNLAFIANALKSLTPEELDQVRVLFVSVDPERDDPARLAEYTAYFHPSILGVTGTPEQLAAAARLYGAAYRRTEQSGSAMGYLVDHSAYTYVVDPEGRLVATLDHATPSDAIAAAIRRHLRVAPPAG
jgi:protein SCO1/2